MDHLATPEGDAVIHEFRHLTNLHHQLGEFIREDCLWTVAKRPFRATVHLDDRPGRTGRDACQGERRHEIALARGVRGIDEDGQM